MIVSGLKSRPAKRVNPVVAVPQSVFDKTTVDEPALGVAAPVSLEPVMAERKTAASPKVQEKVKAKDKIKDKNKDKNKDKSKEKQKEKVKSKEKIKEKTKIKEKAKEKAKEKSKGKEKLKAFMLSHVDCMRLKAAAAHFGLSETHIIREGVELWLAAHTEEGAG
jgi:hypothetical protein